MKLHEVVIHAKFGKDKEKADRVAKSTPITMLQAFGSKEMNILHDAGIKLTEKPGYWEDFEEDGYAAKRNIHELAHDGCKDHAERVHHRIP